MNPCKLLKLFIKLAMMANLDLLFMATLKQHIVELLKSIRYSRAQRGDDRCWFDDIRLYRCLPESGRAPVRLSVVQMGELCAHFHQCRSNQEQPRSGQGPRNLDSYLDGMSWWQLIREACRLRAGIRRHRNKGMENRVVGDDKELYALLPEGKDVQADFRLPPAELFLPNCKLICSLVDPEDVDLSQWPAGLTSPLANWRPDDGKK